LVYQAYVNSLNRDVDKIDRLEKIPFLPIEFFKSHKVVTGQMEEFHVFQSSGTTSSQTSHHFVSDLPFYEHLSRKTFEQFYGPLTDYHLFALLPSYLERNNSSLVYMVQNFIASDNRKILLLGVTFGLLDLAENEALSNMMKDVSDKLIVMETGGMKGRRKEMIREDVHEILTSAFGVKSIHSEYGMTELLSQGYSKGEGLFDLPNTMRVLLREVNDPFTYLPSFLLGNPEVQVKYRGKSGGINVIDLANIDTCSFIETKDLGSFSEDYTQFRVVGRFDNSDLRGCNLLVN
jgi:hypothetical protein